MSHHVPIKPKLGATYIPWDKIEVNKEHNVKFARDRRGRAYAKLPNGQIRRVAL